MNAELKQEWTAALRSGEYEQGESALCRNGKYCCLGVAGDILAKKNDAGVEWQDVVDSPGHKRLRGPITRSTIDLPVELRELIGLSPEEQNVLIDLNDNKLKTFAEIADWIDANL